MREWVVEKRDETLGSYSPFSTTGTFTLMCFHLNYPGEKLSLEPKLSLK